VRAWYDPGYAQWLEFFSEHQMENDFRHMCQFEEMVTGYLLTADTVHDLFNSVLIGSGQRFRVIDVINDTTNVVMHNASTAQMNKWFLTQPVLKGSPKYYNFNGVNQYGDTQADLFPVPDGTYNIRFNIIKPQDPFTEDAEAILVPSEPVILGATSRALAERGEDGGLASSDLYQLAKSSLSDAIALESGRYVEEHQWDWV
jgi:hypothetical protein